MTGAPDSIHARGRAAVLAGSALLDVAPGPGGTRWGMSLVVRPDAAAEELLHVLAAEAATVAGPGQWLTGGSGSAHLTVTYLERSWRDVTSGDPHVQRFASALAESVPGLPPLRWRLTGLALADRGVLALAEPVDGAPDELRSRFLSALGDLGEQEAYYRSSVWWATLLHFAAPLTEPEALVEWVDARTTLPPTLIVGARAEIVRYTFDGERTVPVPLAGVPMSGVPVEVSRAAQA